MGNIFQCRFILCEHCCYSGCGKEKEIVTHVDTSHKKWIDSQSGNYIESHEVIKNFSNGNREEKSTYIKGNIFRDNNIKLLLSD